MPTRKKQIEARLLPLSEQPRLIQAAKRKSDDDGAPRKLSIEATATISIEAAKAEGEAAPLPRFAMLANTGNPMRLAGWKYPVVIDFAGLSIPSQNTPMRFGHDPMHGVGHTDAIAIKDGALVASGIISRDTPAARDVVASAKNGFPWQVSAGASADEVEFVRAGEKVTVNGKEFEGPLNVARKSTLGELSFVDLGADTATSARVAAAKKEGNVDDERDDDTSDLNEGARQTRQAIEGAKRERDRQSGIRAIVAEELGLRGANITEIEAIADKALDENWTIKDTQIALLRANRAKNPQVRRADLPSPKMLEASLCLACGISDERLAKDRDYGPDVVNAAYIHRGRGLRGTLAAALEAAGVPVPHGSRELFDAVREHQRIRAEGFSTINLPGILGNVANKILLNAFLAMDATYDLIADQADFSNFHTHSIYRLNHLGDFAQVPKDGELKNGSLDQDGYSNKLETYGQLVTLTRQDIINDDLNAFRTIPATLARKARISVEKALYSKVMEGSDVFYTTGRGNKLTGTIGITELAAAEAALLTMVDAGGDPIYATPRFLLVPPALKYFAEQIYTSQLVNDFTASKARPTDNPFRGRFQVVSSPYLQNATFAGYSASTWYLLADPVMLPAFQVSYLDGRRAPTFETSEAEFNVLGMQMRCYFDFGVAQLDYRGAIKNV